MLSFNKKKRKQQLSERGKKGANARHSRNRTSRFDEPIRQNPVDPIYILTWDNRITGKIHVLEFHNIGKKVSFRITRNGRELPFTSLTDTLDYLLKRRPKIQDHGL